MHTGSRRHFLATSSMGIGGLALAWLLKRKACSPTPGRPELEPRRFDLLPKPTHHEPKARAMISLFMQGGPSHLDLFDPKPAWRVTTASRSPARSSTTTPPRPAPKVLACPWNFRQARPVRHRAVRTAAAPGRGRRRRLPDPLDDDRRQQPRPVDQRPEHGPHRQPAGPCWASWLTYGLGSETQNLPAYVVLTDPASLPVLGVDNWSNGWLPSLYQGTVVRAQEPRILNLDPPPHMRGDAAGSLPAVSRTTQPRARRGTPRRAGPGGPHRQLRAGRPHADCRAARPSTSARRDRGDQAPVRHRRARRRPSSAPAA